MVILHRCLFQEITACAGYSKIQTRIKNNLSMQPGVNWHMLEQGIVVEIPVGVHVQIMAPMRRSCPKLQKCEASHASIITNKPFWWVKTFWLLRMCFVFVKRIMPRIQCVFLLQVLHYHCQHALVERKAWYEHLFSLIPHRVQDWAV